MKEKATNKGITLIALVITIIVLLILAGVTLNLTLGENGLLKRAEESKTAHLSGEKNDIDFMNNAYDYMNPYFEDSGVVKFELELIEKVNGIETVKSIGKYEVTKGTTWRQFFTEHVEITDASPLEMRIPGDLFCVPLANR